MLTPSSSHRCVQPGAGLQAALQAVADRALQVGESAIASYRLHRSSRAENAAILRQAVRDRAYATGLSCLRSASVARRELADALQVRVVALVTRCAVTDGADLSGLLEAQLLAAAHVRCRALLATVGAPATGWPPFADPLAHCLWYTVLSLRLQARHC